MLDPFVLTARQYGEVVLPDASTGQSPGSLAEKLSRCKEGMAHFLPSWYKFYWVKAWSRYKFAKWLVNCHGCRKLIDGHWRSVAVQFVSEPEISHDAGFQLRADARVRVQQPLQIYLDGRSKAKSVTNNLPILSVLGLGF